MLSSTITVQYLEKLTQIFSYEIYQFFYMSSMVQYIIYIPVIFIPVGSKSPIKIYMFMFVL